MLGAEVRYFLDLFICTNVCFVMFSNRDHDLVTSHLKSLNIHFSEEWVLESINYFKSLNKFITSSELNNAVYQKWCSTDLRDLKTGSFPINLASSNKAILNGKYAVQVESMLDSSKSSYSELRKLQKISECTDIGEGTAEETTSKRCLVFSLCDGVTEIHAMEYQPIPNIIPNGSDFLPGFKMLLTGPILCRKGMLLLKKDNVRIYGGKVESLCETNNLKSLILKNLGLNCSSNEINSCQETITKDGKRNFPKSHSASNIMQNRAHVSFPEPEVDSTIRPSDFNELLSENDDILVSLSFDSRSFPNENSQSEMSQNNAEVASDIFSNPYMINYNTFLTEENKNSALNYNLNNSNVEISELVSEELPNFETNKKPRMDKQNLWDEESSLCKESTSDNMAYFENESSFRDKSFQSATSFSREGNCEKFKRKVTQEDFPNEFSQFFNAATTEEFNFTCANREKKKSPQNVKPYPYVYLKQAVDVLVAKPATFVVKAMIFTLKSKISIKNNKFALKASISDGSYTIQANFSSEILENILEYSPCEISSFINEKNKNSAICERLKSIFFSAQQKLMSMNCLMEIKFFNDGSDPLVVGLEEIKITHLNALKERMI